MKRDVLVMIVCGVALRLTGAAETTPQDYQEVLSILGKKGDYKEHVLKVNIPRNDLKVTVAGVQTRRPLASGAGWR